MYGSRPYKQFSVFVIIFFLISVTIFPFFTLHTESEIETDSNIFNQDDGVYYIEDFTEISSDNLDNTRVESGDILLDANGITQTLYDFSNWSNESNHKMYTFKSFRFFPFIPLIVHLYYANQVTSSENIDLVSTKDSQVYPLNASTSRLKQVHMFQFKIDEHPSLVNKLGLTWHGKAENDASSILYYWQPSSTIDNLGTWQIADNTTSNGSDVTLRQNFTGDLFVDTNGYVTFCVVATPIYGKQCSLSTDYVSLFSQTTGYATKGTVRSILITPSIIDRWETFRFSDENETETSIKYHLFYENETSNLTYVEEQYAPGNLAGLDHAPVDLSQIPNEYNLTIQANLSTNDRSRSPILSAWSLTWQKEQYKWQDSFTSSLRLDTNSFQHVKRNKGNITLLPILNHWPMIGGETAANTRTSSGLGPVINYNLSWYSSVKVGGEHKQPVIQSGILYITSKDGAKLYSFDAQATTGITTYNPIQNRLHLPTHTIENTPLVTEHAVIVATGASQLLGGITNYIYAFDKDFSETPIWRFDYGSVHNTSAISYASSPVYDEGNIYITSWNGDDSLLNSVWNFINFSRGNNKVISINDQGEFNWDYSIPTASFSSPAVKDGTIIAGCEQINGDSLFALNDEGVMQWKQSVGPIGYASPVIYENKVIVISKEPSNLYVTAKTKVSVLRLDNGEILWNKTIGLNSSTLPYRYAGYNSPVVTDDTIFVSSPDGVLHAFDVDSGTEHWKKTIYSRGLLPTEDYLVSSPAYADGILYIGTPEGKCYAINAETNETIWIKNTKDGTGVVSSPIIVDGFIYFTEKNNVIQCLGQLNIPSSERITGSVLSKPIIYPDDDIYEWDTFFSNYSHTRGDITFHITDETGKSILSSDVINGQTISTTSVNNHDSIRIKADFSMQASGSLQLHDWAVSFRPDGAQDNITVFYEDSFSGTPPNCSIDVRNQDIGLWNSTAAYRFTYTNESGDQSSTWIPTTVTGANGSTARETIWANISALGFAENITGWDQIRFKIKDTNGDETVSSWFDFEIEITDTSEPIFDNQSFTPSSGWVKTVTPTCTIQVQDQGTQGNSTGLNTSSAMYRLNYTDDSGIQTETFEAVCTGSMGTQAKQTIRAIIADNPESENITDVTAIQFTIADVAGNINSSSWFTISVDDEEPSSQISNTGSIPAATNISPVLIEANAEDEESGIDKVTLYYRLKGLSQWNSFASDSTEPYEWDFTIDTDEGGEYELCTIATDNAENQESFPTQIQVVFLFDPNPPSPPSFADEYRFTEAIIPSFTDVTFADDYQLKQVEYRLNFEGLNEWTIINNENLTDKTYTPTWNLTAEQWNQMQEDITYHMYFKVIDFLGNTYITPSQTQTLKLIKDIENDTTFDPDLSDFDVWQWDNEYTIGVNRNDSNISLIQLWYQYSSDNTTWTNWTQYDENKTEYPYEWSFTLPKGSGYYRFKSTVYTSQGSAEYINEEIIYIITFPLLELIVMSSLVIILFVVSALIFKRRKQLR